MVLTNTFQSFNLFLIFVLTLFPAVTMNVAPFSAYKTTQLKVCMYHFYRQKLACSMLVVLFFTSCEYISHALIKYEPSIFPTFPNQINYFQNSIFYFL